MAEYGPNQWNWYMCNVFSHWQTRKSPSLNFLNKFVNNLFMHFQPKLHITGPLCEENPPVTSNAESASISWGHHSRHISNHTKWESCAQFLGFTHRSMTSKALMPTAPSCIDNSWRSTTHPAADSATSSHTLPVGNEHQWVLENNQITGSFVATNCPAMFIFQSKFHFFMQ